METFKQLTVGTYDEEVVRNRLDQLKIPHRHIWASAGHVYGIETFIDGDSIKAYVEGFNNKWWWTITKV